MSWSCGDWLRAFDFRAEPIIAEHTAPALTRGLSELIHICVHIALRYKKISKYWRLTSREREGERRCMSHRFLYYTPQEASSWCAHT